MREPRVLNWAGGEAPFLLRIGEMLALEKLCGTGIGAVFGRLSASLTGAPQWHVADITETLRLGLIGGGASREDAQAAVTRATEMAGLLALAPTAMTVLLISLKSEDPAEEEEEESPAGAKKKSRRAGSTPPISTATAR
jgi:hypothetical protein